MGLAEITRDTETRLKKSIEAAVNDFATLRTGRANPALLDALRVDYFGTPTPLNQIAAVNAPEARTLIITPWEKTMLPAIAKAIMNSDLGLSPNNDGIVIRLNIPQLTEQRRKEFVKQLAGKGEAARVSLRNIRRDANEQFKKDEDVTDDDAKRGEKDVQKLLDKYVAELDTLLKAKETELLED